MIDKIFLICDCGSKNLVEIKREAISKKRFTDHVIWYECKDCGKIVKKGE